VLIHRIHQRVLEHIRRLSEAEPSGPLCDAPHT
jgi:hypothetical protein